MKITFKKYTFTFHIKDGSADCETSHPAQLSVIASFNVLDCIALGSPPENLVSTWSGVCVRLRTVLFRSFYLCNASHPMQVTPNKTTANYCQAGVAVY